MDTLWRTISRPFFGPDFCALLFSHSREVWRHAVKRPLPNLCCIFVTELLVLCFLHLAESVRIVITCTCASIMREPVAAHRWQRLMHCVDDACRLELLQSFLSCHVFQGPRQSLRARGSLPHSSSLSCKRIRRALASLDLDVYCIVKSCSE